LEYGTITIMRLLFSIFLMASTSVSAQSYVDDYSPTTYENISNLMWKYNIHDAGDAGVYKAYFQSTKCDLFKKYYKDDFLWQTIIEGFKRNNKYFSSDIPNKFYINASIPIDRYDFAKAVFIIDEQFALDNADAIQIPFYEGKLIKCDSRIEDKYFPHRVKFIADRKFAMDEIPIGMDDANALLTRIKQYKYENTDLERIIAVRFLITINGVQNYDSEGTSPEIKYKGSLDEIAFFEDPQMTKPIWKSIRRS